MKKLLFSAAILLCAFCTQAQTTKLTITNTLGSDYYVDFFGDIAGAPPCDMNRNTGMTLVMAGASVTRDATMPIWPGSGVTSQFNHYILAIDLGGGVWDYGTTRPDVCTSAPAGGTYNFYASAPVNVMYNVLGPDWIEVVIY